MLDEKLSNKESAVVVFSGGQDSTTCLLWARKHYKKVYAVSFDYNQRHKLELQCAREICEKLEVEHTVLDMKLLNQLAPNSLTRMDMTVDENAPETGTPNTFVDGRNMVFLTFVAIFAKQKGVHDIITGVSQSDFSGYPDCRDVFIKSLNVTLNLAMDYEFDIITPLMWIDKEQTWELADRLGGFDLVRNMTLTCYNGIKGDGCGHCPACKLRKKGLDLYLEKKASVYN
ncbi:MAG: 7-cyano-7-deazaguanine synthase QueC [Wujia sp.]